MVNSTTISFALQCVSRKMAVKTVIRSVFVNYRHYIYSNFSSTSQAKKSFVINNNEDFVNKVMNSDVPVIVNFHAEWCDPCKVLSPKLKELVDPMDDIHLAIIDIDSNAELVDVFKVKAVPAVLAVRNGLVVDKFVGLVDADMIKNLIKKLTSKISQDV